MFSCRYNRREVRQPYFSLLMIVIVPSEFHSSSEFYTDTKAETGRNRVYIQIMQFGSQGLLVIKSQFWKLPPPSRPLLPAAVALGFPEYEQFLAFSKERTSFPGKLRTTTYLPASCFLICKWKGQCLVFLFTRWS